MHTNTVIDSETIDPETEVSPTPSRRRPAVLVAGALLVALLTVGVGTGSAGAITIGGNGASGVPGTSYSTVYCKRGTITVAPQASVQSGYTGGQYISYRFYLSNNRGYSGTSGWSGARLVGFNNYLWGELPPLTFAASLNTVWSVQVQYAYWRFQNGQWVASYTNWQPATYVVSSGFSAGSSYTTNACYT